MDQTTKWLIRIMAVSVIAGIGGFAIYSFQQTKIRNQEIERSKKLEAEDYCKNTNLYKMGMNTSARLLNYKQIEAGKDMFNKTMAVYKECLQNRINRE